MYLGSKLLLVGGRDPEECKSNLPLEVLYIFERSNRITSTHRKLLLPLSQNHEYVAYHAFVGSNDKTHFVLVGNSLFKFDASNFRWMHVPLIKGRCQMCNEGLSARCFRCNRRGASGSLIAHDTLLVAGGTGPNANICDIVELGRIANKSLVKDFRQPYSSDYNDRSIKSPCWIRCPTHLPLWIEDHTLLNIQNSKVILIGGYSAGLQESNRTFLGVLAKSHRDVLWTELASMEQPRAGHVSFKIGDFVYVAGGVRGTKRLVSCERYDVRRNIWETLKQVLPYPIRHASAVVDSKGKYCFISGGLKSQNLGPNRTSVKWKTSSNLIVYHINDGFKLYNDAFYANREKHISILI